MNAKALKNASAIDRRMKVLEARLPYSSYAVQVQITTQLRKLRAARNVSLNA